MSTLRVTIPTAITQPRPPIEPLPEEEEVHYPDSDGEPMGETGFHVQQIISTTAILRDRFRRQTDVYVGTNMFLYYRQGDPSAVFSPDVFVVFDTTNQERRSWKMWEEDERAPVIVLEFTSKDTRDKDLLFKRALYEDLGVQEYFLFDPQAEYLEPVLQGYRLVEGRYAPLPGRRAEDGVWELESVVLDVILRAEPARAGGGGELALYDKSTGERLLAPHQTYERLREEVKAHRATEARAAEEAAARRAAEAELTRLRAELARLRSEEQA